MKDREDIVVNNIESSKKYTVGISHGDIYETVLQNMGFQKQKII